ncbi:MAG: FAD-binding oxidoreductase [Dehalococcoidales bacterium]|nr:FAD-binding oxidoreductase [Dehalococcoidales bacterium]
MALKEELAGIVSSENVFDDPETLDAYSRDFSFVKPVKPRVVVKPGSADEVQALVRWANQIATPLVPVSSGPPRFHGDTVPGVPGAVIVDLSGMKKVMRIDRRNRVAMVEPGVTYSELQPELAREGLRLTTPLLPRASKSVVASLLEREPTLIPRQQWASLDPLRCTEIVWGDGQKLITGDAGMWSSMEEAWVRKQAPAGATGPGQVDYYRFVSAAQGSMGIVTWASVKCEILPALHKLFFVPAQRPDDLLDFTYQLLKFRFADELLLLNNASLAAILGNGADHIKALMKELPPWVVLVGIAGRSVLPAERVEYQEKDIADIARRFGQQLVSEIPGAGSDEVLKAILNPSREPYWKLDLKGGYQDILFLTTLNRTPEFIKTMNSVAEASGYPASDIGVYIQPLHQGANVHCEFILPFDRDNPEEATRMQQLLTIASEELIEQGAFFSRPYGIWADLAYGRDAQTTMVLKKLKGIFDPNNVMNPGKLCF